MNLQSKVKSPVAKRSLVIGTSKTSVTLETPFWEALKEIAASENLTPGELVARIDQERKHPNRSSAIRLYVLEHYRPACRRRAHCEGKPVMKRGRPKTEMAKPLKAEPPATESEEAQEEAEPNEAQTAIDSQERLRRREEERRDAEAAVTEYFAEQEAARNRMATLRAQRLTKEAKDKAKPKTVKQKRQ